MGSAVASASNAACFHQAKTHLLILKFRAGVVSFLTPGIRRQSPKTNVPHPLPFRDLPHVVAIVTHTRTIFFTRISYYTLQTHRDIPLA